MRVSSFVAVLLGLLPIPASAQQALAPQQEVQGTVTEGGTLAPIEGAMILLLDEGGRRMGGVLSAVNGRFRVPVPAPGRYRLRVDRIGYGSMDTEPFEVPAGASVQWNVVSAVRPVELAGIDVRGEGRCEVRPTEGVATATVWEEVRKALDAATWTSERELYSFSWTRYQRELDENARRVLSETRTNERGYTISPFAADDPTQLTTRGFVEELPGGDLQYSAPDARVLLSDAFLDTHCFRVAEEERSGGARIGLAFEPLRDSPLRDIEGVLWIDRSTAMLESLEFRYTNLIAGLDQHSAGGDLTFEHLPNGTWIVKEWSIRMPLVEELRTGRRLGNLRNLSVTGYRAEGGAVLRATSNTGAVVMDNVAGGIRGVVLDSIGDPVPAEPVRIAGTSTEAVTGVDGTFTFTGVGAGRWTVTAAPFAFTAAGVEPPGVEVEVGPTGMSSVRLQLPTLSSALLSACAETPPGRGEAVVAGRVLDRNGELVPGAQVRLRWQNIMGEGGGLVVQNASTTDLAGPDGSFRFCTIPAGVTVSARATLGGRISEERQVTISGQSGVVSLFLPDAGVIVASETSAAGVGKTASLRFQVTDAATGEPVSGARVGFPELRLFVLSNVDGNAVLAEIPPGGHVLEVTMQGFGDASASIRLAPGAVASGSVALTTRPIAIEGITVTAAAPMDAASRSTTITGAELVESAGAQLTVLDAIQRLRPNWMRSRGELSLRNVDPGGPARGVPASCGRGATSCSALDQTSGRNPPGVLVDGVPQPFEVMEAMSATEVMTLEFLSAGDATTRFGTGYTNGAILITTHARQR
jgi:hypothetical protein